MSLKYHRSGYPSLPSGGKDAAHLHGQLTQRPIASQTVVQFIYLVCDLRGRLHCLCLPHTPTGRSGCRHLDECPDHGKLAEAHLHFAEQ